MKVTPMPIEQIAHLVPPGFFEDEKEYWRLRPKLMKKYRGKYVAIRDKKVVLAGDDFFEIAHEATLRYGYAFIERVGKENEPVYINRISFNYDVSKSPSEPSIEVTFGNFDRTRSIRYKNVLPDTGADLTCLPVDDALRLGLFKNVIRVLPLYSLDSAGKRSLICEGTAKIGDKDYLSTIVILLESQLRLLGRDVLNQTIVTFNGLERKVIFEN